MEYCAPQVGYNGSAKLLQSAAGDVGEVRGGLGEVGQDALDALALVAVCKVVVR